MTNSVSAASDSISTNLESGAFGDDVSRNELVSNNDILAGLSSQETNEVIESLSDEELDSWMDEAYESNIILFQSGGLNSGERQDLFNNFARDLQPDQLQRVHDALGQNDRQAELAKAVDRHAPADVQTAFIERTAHTDITDNISGGLTNAEIHDISATLERLSPEQANEVFQALSDEQLHTLASEIHDNGWIFSDGLNESERLDLFDSMATKLDGQQLSRFSQALGADSSGELAQQIASTASVSTRQDYIRESLAIEQDERRTDFNFGSYTTERTNSHHRNAATVASGLRGNDATELFESISAQAQQNLFIAAADVSSTTITSGGYGGYAMPSESIDDVDASAFNSLVDSAASVSDPALRADLTGLAIGTLHNLDQTANLSGRESREIAEHIVDSIDAGTLSQLSPDANAALAISLTAGGEVSIDAVDGLRALAPSASRDTLIRTVFGKVPEQAYENNPELADSMARALVATTGSQLSFAQRADAGSTLSEQLQSGGGRSLLANQNVHPAARLWAAEQLMSQPEVLTSALGAADNAWETPAVIELYAQSRMDQIALGQGDRAVPVSGFNIENLVGASLNASPRADVPADLNSISTEINAGEYNFFEGNDGISKVADGIRAAQEDLGDGPISVATIPIQFSSEQSGPIDLTLYRVESAGGTRFVDTEGRTYTDVENWSTENVLPPGQVTYPSGLVLNDGSTPVSLETSVTPNVRDTTWEHVKHWGDIAALGLGAIASGVIIFGSGGLATPVVAGAWGVAGGAAIWTTARGIESLHDRASHNQSLSLSDPDARAAWLSVAAGGLTLSGGALIGTASRAANGSQLAVSTARSAGILNTSANYVDAATAANDLHTLYSQWDNLTPGQRAQTALSVAFWSGMTGVSARMGNGTLGDLSFADNVNRAMIETGARVTPDSGLYMGTARISFEDDGILSVQHHPDAPDYVVRAHQDAAHDLLSNGNTGAAMQRFFGFSDAYPARSFGEATAVEIAKHEQLIDSLNTQLSNGDIPASQVPAAEQTLADYQFELRNYQADLAHIRANPEVGFATGPDSIDVKKTNAFRVGFEAEDLTRTPAAELPFDTIVSPDLQQQFPDATRVEYNDLNADLSLTLSDGTTISKTGDQGNRLAQILRPVEQGGWGGAVFHDTATDTLIVSVNIRKTGAVEILDRVEVSFARNDAGEWRVDFGDHVVYSNQIDSGLAPVRRTHFAEANRILSAELSGDADLEALLDLGTLERSAVDSGAGVSPQPYTWHHVDGDGNMQLVNEAIHSFFNHAGGFSEWRGN